MFASVFFGKYSIGILIFHIYFSYFFVKECISTRNKTRFVFMREQVFLMWQPDAEKSLLTFAFYSITGINNIFIFKVNIQN